MKLGIEISLQLIQVLGFDKIVSNIIQKFISDKKYKDKLIFDDIQEI